MCVYGIKYSSLSEGSFWFTVPISSCLEPNRSLQPERLRSVEVIRADRPENAPASVTAVFNVLITGSVCAVRCAWYLWSAKVLQETFSISVCCWCQRSCVTFFSHLLLYNSTAFDSPNLCHAANPVPAESLQNQYLVLFHLLRVTFLLTARNRAEFVCDSQRFTSIRLSSSIGTLTHTSFSRPVTPSAL